MISRKHFPSLVLAAVENAKPAVICSKKCTSWYDLTQPKQFQTFAKTGFDRLVWVNFGRLSSRKIIKIILFLFSLYLLLCLKCFSKRGKTKTIVLIKIGKRHNYNSKGKNVHNRFKKNQKWFLSWITMLSAKCYNSFFIFIRGKMHQNFISTISILHIKYFVLIKLKINFAIFFGSSNFLSGSTSYPQSLAV
jgi:hypothetical protein